MPRARAADPTTALYEYVNMCGTSQGPGHAATNRLGQATTHAHVYPKLQIHEKDPILNQPLKIE